MGIKFTIKVEFLAVRMVPGNDNLVECLTKRYQGLYFLSQPWLSCRASGLIMGVAHDFKRLVV